MINTMLVIGIILSVISAIGISVTWPKNEWRLPLFEVYSALERVDRPKISGFYSNIKRGTIGVVLILYGLYLIGASLLYFRYPRTWLLIVICLIALWLLKAVVGLIRAAYSRKTRLLNYLYSPYIFAWRRDHWSDFTDSQIAAAICEVTGTDTTDINFEEDSLESFLISLCKITRPAYEAKRYTEVVKDLKQQAENMVFSG